MRQNLGALAAAVLFFCFLASLSSAQSNDNGPPFWGCYANNNPGGANGASWNSATRVYAEGRALEVCEDNRERGEPQCRVVACEENVKDEEAAMAKWR